MIIDPWDQAVRVRLGRYTKVLKGGTYFKIPVIDNYYVQSCRFRISGYGDRQSWQTLDHKIITFVIAVGYKIEDISKLYNSVHHAEDTIKAIVLSKAATYISERKVEDITIVDMTKILNEMLNFSEYGLVDVSVFISNVTCAKTYRLIGDYTYGNNGSILSTEEVK